MNIGFIGLGKVGLPCSLAIESKGHSLFGFDVNGEIKKILDDKTLPYKEKGALKLLKKSKIKWSDISEIVKKTEIIFVSIQTPHEKKYEGITRLPKERKDFDYSWLKEGIKNLALEIEKNKQEKIIIIMSTVLPGTINDEIKPLLNKWIKLCYNPFFIAMGTTIDDFLKPEFVLLGVEDEKTFEKVKNFYSTLHKKVVYKCSIEEAELIKVSYNTYITMKICLANTIMEMSHKLKNINCDNIMNGLFLAKERLISPKYLKGGMGDGGGCHPRDNIALSWLAQKNNLSYDWYENLMICREKQTEWLANLAIEKSKECNLPIIILGKCFKKETNLINGSPAILLKNLIEEKINKVKIFDPWIDKNEKAPLDTKAVFFIGTNHDVFCDYFFPENSIVIDPWRIIKKQKNVELISIGNKNNNK